MIKNILNELNLDILVVVGFGGKKTEMKKPNAELFHIAIKKFNNYTRVQLIHSLLPRVRRSLAPVV